MNFWRLILRADVAVVSYEGAHNGTGKWETADHGYEAVSIPQGCRHRFRSRRVRERLELSTFKQ